MSRPARGSGRGTGQNDEERLSLTTALMFSQDARGAAAFLPSNRLLDLTTKYYGQCVKDRETFTGVRNVLLHDSLIHSNLAPQGLRADPGSVDKPMLQYMLRVEALTQALGLSAMHHQEEKGGSPALPLSASQRAMDVNSSSASSSSSSSSSSLTLPSASSASKTFSAFAYPFLIQHLKASASMQPQSATFIRNLFAEHVSSLPPFSVSPHGAHETNALADMASIYWNLHGYDSCTDDARRRAMGNLLKYWLGVSSILMCLNAVEFALSQTLTAAPTSTGGDLSRSNSAVLDIGPYLEEWSQTLEYLRRGVIYSHQWTVATDIALNAERVAIGTVSPSSSSSSHTKGSNSATNTKSTGRKWEFSLNNGWVRYDHRVSSLLEAAYRSKQPSVDFQLDGKPYIYRIDFATMKERNLQMGRERGIRTLLSLLVRDSNGCAYQNNTIEINMPANTKLMALRKELANYLKHKEHLLRIMVGNRVLYRDETRHLTIREGIVPMVDEELVVTMLEEGDLEDVCSVALTDLTPTSQRVYVCHSCSMADNKSYVCVVCAARCHKGHRLTLLPQKRAVVCHCGSNCIPSMKTCLSVPTAELNTAQVVTPRMCAHPRGTHVFLLSSEHGLLKMGTGKGGTVCGKMYAQNATMAVHAGGYVCCVELTQNAFSLLLRTPLLDNNTLLVVNADTLTLTNQSVCLTPSVHSSADALPAYSESEDWELFYPVDVDSAPSSSSSSAAASKKKPKGDAADASVRSKEASSARTRWKVIPSLFARKVKARLLSNWVFGTVILESSEDERAMELFKATTTKSPSSVRAPVLRGKCVVLERDGLFLVRRGKYDETTKVRLRIIQGGNGCLPVFHTFAGNVRGTWVNSIEVMRAIKESPDDFPLSPLSRKMQASSHIEHRVVVDTYSLKADVVVPMIHCYSCGGLCATPSNANLRAESAGDTKQVQDLAWSVDNGVPCSFCDSRQENEQTLFRSALQKSFEVDAGLDKADLAALLYLQDSLDMDAAEAKEIWRVLALLEEREQGDMQRLSEMKEDNSSDADTPADTTTPRSDPLLRTALSESGVPGSTNPTPAVSSMEWDIFGVHSPQSKSRPGRSLRKMLLDLYGGAPSDKNPLVSRRAADWKRTKGSRGDHKHSECGSGFDGALKQSVLVCLGFPAEQATLALQMTESRSVTSAVVWLLQQDYDNQYGVQQVKDADGSDLYSPVSPISGDLSLSSSLCKTDGGLPLDTSIEFEGKRGDSGSDDDVDSPVGLADIGLLLGVTPTTSGAIHTPASAPLHTTTESSPPVPDVFTCHVMWQICAMPAGSRATELVLASSQLMRIRSKKSKSKSEGTRVCDGCGLTFSRDSPRSLDGFVCAEASCENLYLCKHCYLMDRFTSATHRAGHFVRSVVNPGSGSSHTHGDQESKHQAPMPEALGEAHELSIVYNSDAGIYIVFRAPEGRGGSSNAKQHVAVYDALSGKFRSNQVFGLAGVTACCYDGSAHALWMYSSGTSKLSLVPTVRTVARRGTPSNDPLAGGGVHAIDAACWILQHLTCHVTEPARITLALGHLDGILRLLLAASKGGSEAGPFRLHCSAFRAMDGVKNSLSDALRLALQLVHSCLQRLIVVSARGVPLDGSASGVLSSICDLLEEGALGAASTTTDGLGSSCICNEPHMRACVHSRLVLSRLVADVYVCGFNLFHVTWSTRLKKLNALLQEGSYSYLLHQVCLLYSRIASGLGFLPHAQEGNDEEVDVFFLQTHSIALGCVDLLLKRDTDAWDVVSDTHTSTQERKQTRTGASPRAISEFYPVIYYLNASIRELWRLHGRNDASLKQSVNQWLQTANHVLLSGLKLLHACQQTSGTCEAKQAMAFVAGSNMGHLMECVALQLGLDFIHWRQFGAVLLHSAVVGNLAKCAVTLGTLLSATDDVHKSSAGLGDSIRMLRESQLLLRPHKVKVSGVGLVLDTGAAAPLVIERLLARDSRHLKKRQRLTQFAESVFTGIFGEFAAESGSMRAQNLSRYLRATGFSSDDLVSARMSSIMSTYGERSYVGDPTCMTLNGFLAMVADQALAEALTCKDPREAGVTIGATVQNVLPESKLLRGLLFMEHHHAFKSAVLPGRPLMYVLDSALYKVMLPMATAIPAVNPSTTGATRQPPEGGAALQPLTAEERLDALARRFRVPVVRDAAVGVSRGLFTSDSAASDVQELPFSPSAVAPTAPVNVRIIGSATASVISVYRAFASKPGSASQAFEFIKSFVNAPVLSSKSVYLKMGNKLRSKRSSKAVARDLPVDLQIASETDGGHLLAFLLQRCLTELGGTYFLNANGVDTHTGAWKPTMASLFKAERAFVACVLLYTPGLLEACEMFAQSVTLAELLNKAKTQSFVRVIQLGSLPRWYAGIVRACFSNVRGKVVEMLQAHRDAIESRAKVAQETAESKIPETKVNIGSTATRFATPGVPSDAVSQIPGAVDRFVDSVWHNSSFLYRMHEPEPSMLPGSAVGNSPCNRSVDYSVDEGDADGSDDDADEIKLLSASQEKLSLSMKRAKSDVSSPTRKKKKQHRSVQIALSVEENLSSERKEIVALLRTFTSSNRQTPRSRLHKSKSNANSNRFLASIANPASAQLSLDAGSHEKQTQSPFITSWTVRHSSDSAVDAAAGDAHALLHSNIHWIAALCAVARPLEAYFKTSVETHIRHESMMVKVLGELVLIDGNEEEGLRNWLATVLPALKQSNLVAVLCDASNHTRNKELDAVLLKLYQRLATALNQPFFAYADAEQGMSDAWSIGRTVIEFIHIGGCLTDVYLASGIFNALLKFVHRIDVWLASDARSSIGPEHLLLAFETRSVAWTCFLRVIQPSVENSAGLRDSPPHQRFTIAASVGHTLVLSTKQLLAAVKHAFRTHSTLDKQDAGGRFLCSFPLQPGNPSYDVLLELNDCICRADDALHIMAELSGDCNVCSDAQFIDFLGILADFNALPVSLTERILNFISAEIIHHDSVLSSEGDADAVHVIDLLWGVTAALGAEAEVLCASEASASGSAHNALEEEKLVREEKNVQPTPDSRDDDLGSSHSMGSAKPECGLSDKLVLPTVSSPSESGDDNSSDGHDSEVSVLLDRGSVSVAALLHQRSSTSQPISHRARPGALGMLRARLEEARPRHTPHPTTRESVRDPLPARVHDIQRIFSKCALVRCSNCQIVRFPVCLKHKSLLSKHVVGADGSHVAMCDVSDDCEMVYVARPDDLCDVCNGAKCMYSYTLNKQPLSKNQVGTIDFDAGRKAVLELDFVNVSKLEAAYCNSAILVNKELVVPHCVFRCSDCNVVEFPGTKHGGLVLDIANRLYDRSTKRFLSQGLYKFTHLTPGCTGTVSKEHIRLSKSEAGKLGYHISGTPSISNTLNRAKTSETWGGDVTLCTIDARDAHSQHTLPAGWAFHSFQSPTRTQKRALQQSLLDLLRSALVKPEASDSSSILDARRLKRWEVVVDRVEQGMRRTPALLNLLGSLSCRAAMGDQAWDERVLYGPEGINLTQLFSSVSVAWEIVASVKRQGSSVSPQTLLVPVLAKLWSPVQKAVADMTSASAQSNQAPRRNESVPPLGAHTVYGALHGFIQTCVVDTVGVLLTDPCVRTALNADEVKAVAVRLSCKLLEPLYVSNADHELIRLRHDTSAMWRHLSDNEGLQMRQLTASVGDAPCKYVESKDVTLREEWGAVSFSGPLPSDALVGSKRAAPFTSDDRKNQIGSLRSALANCATLVEMGYSADVAKYFLAIHDGNMSEAMEMLLMHPLTGSDNDDDPLDPATCEAAWDAYLARLAVLQPVTRRPNQRRTGDSTLRFRNLHSGKLRITGRGTNAPDSPTPSSSSSARDAKHTAPESSLGDTGDSSQSVPVATSKDDMPVLSSENARHVMLSGMVLKHDTSLSDASSLNNLSSSTADLSSDGGISASLSDVDALLAAASASPSSLSGGNSRASFLSSDRLSDRLSELASTGSPLDISLETPSSFTHLPHPYEWESSADRGNMDFREVIRMIRRGGRSHPDRKAHLDAQAAHSKHSVAQFVRFLHALVLPETDEGMVKGDFEGLVGLEVTISQRHVKAWIAAHCVKEYRLSSETNKAEREQYKPGDKLTIVDLVNKVCNAEVVRVSPDNGSVFIHYVNWSKKWDEWVEVTSPRILPKCEVGDKLNVLDRRRKEAEVEIQEVLIRDNQLQIFIHFSGQDSGADVDEWIDAMSDRIVSRHSDGPKFREDEVIRAQLTMAGPVPMFLLADDVDIAVYGGAVLAVECLQTKPAKESEATQAREGKDKGRRLLDGRSELTWHALVRLNVDSSTFYCLWVPVSALLPVVNAPFETLGRVSGVAQTARAAPLRGFNRGALLPALHAMQRSVQSLQIMQIMQQLLTMDAGQGRDAKHTPRLSVCALPEPVQHRALISVVSGAQDVDALVKSLVGVATEDTSTLSHLQFDWLGVLERYIYSDFAWPSHVTKASSLISLAPNPSASHATVNAQVIRVWYPDTDIYLQEISVVAMPQERLPPIHDSFLASATEPTMTLSIYSDVQCTCLLKTIVVEGTGARKHGGGYKLPFPLLVPNPVYCKVQVPRKAYEQGGACAAAVVNHFLLSVPGRSRSVDTLSGVVQLLAHTRRLFAVDAVQPTHDKDSLTIEAYMGRVEKLLRHAFLALCERFILLEEACSQPSVLKQDVVCSLSYCLLSFLGPCRAAESAVVNEMWSTVHMTAMYVSLVKVLVTRTADRYAAELPIHGGLIYSVRLKRYIEALVLSVRLVEQCGVRGRVFGFSNLDLEGSCPYVPAINSILTRKIGLLAHQAHPEHKETAAAGVLFPRDHKAGEENCACQRCTEVQQNLPAVITLLDTSPSSVWRVLLRGAVSNYDEVVCKNDTPVFAAVLVPGAALRASRFRQLLELTSTKSRTLPELEFSHEGEESTDSSSSRPWEQFMLQCRPFLTTMRDSARYNDDSAAVLLSAAHVGDYVQVLRSRPGSIPWRTVFRGVHDEGMAGLPGPFRQAMHEICNDLTRNTRVSAEDATATSLASPPSSSSHGHERKGTSRDDLFILSANGRAQFGEEQNKLVLNPSFTDTDRLYALGQLIGVALRSGCCLNIDVEKRFWKLLLDVPLEESDLKSFDLAFYKTIESSDNFSSVILSDGHTVVPVSPPDKAACINTRLYECWGLVKHVKRGLYSIVHAESLMWLTPRELELHVSGSPELDLDKLKRHTSYSPKTFNEDHKHVRMFWAVLAEFTVPERKTFLQFCWARNRLPDNMSTHRLQVYFLETKHGYTHLDNELPTSETCFFNLTMPCYSSRALMHAKLKFAIENCSSITS